MNSINNSWERFKQYYKHFPDLGLAVDTSRINFTAEFLASIDSRMTPVFSAMAKLEGGAIANPDEKRMVGHYWLRNPKLAPKREISEEITRTLASIEDFAQKIHSGEMGSFKNILIIGIGGSALGPQFVGHALSAGAKDKMRPFFFDNTDPDGIDMVLESLQQELRETLCLVISKSGGTKETQNGMLEAKAVFERSGLSFSKHAVAITGNGSHLDQLATRDGWLARFPMWDWVGGRTSETSAVGLLPAALQGIDIRTFLAGAKACDDVTRVPNAQGNPAAMLALAWLHATKGVGAKDMVILPYKDRLALFSRYLQQLVMESLGKARDLNEKLVEQGIAVYGNKGSTDQHAYVQQLRDGVNKFFVTFIEVLKDRTLPSLEVEPGVTSGDYLNGFYLGTRQALYENNRESISITVNDVSPFSVGVLIALYERAVGFYASLVNINAYHQPGVEAGKKAATDVLALKKKVLSVISAASQPLTCSEIAALVNEPQRQETIFKLCEHLAANRRLSKVSARETFQARYSVPR